MTSRKTAHEKSRSRLAPKSEWPQLHQELESLGYEIRSPDFLRALIENNAAAVSIFLRTGTDPNLSLIEAGFDMSLNAIQIAAETSDIECVELLLRFGAECGGDADEADEEVTSVLAFAASRSSEDPHAMGVLAMLLEAGADVNGWMGTEVGRQTVTACALAAENMPILRALLEAGADPDAGNEDEVSPRGHKTLLMLAAQEGQIEACKVLIEFGANIDVQSDDGATALMDAAFEQNAEIVELLIEKGADVNLRGDNGRTALLCGIEDIAVTRQLLEAGADPNVTIDTGVGPLSAAVYYEDEELVRLLIETGASIEALPEIGKRQFKEALDDCDNKKITALFSGAEEQLRKFELDDELTDAVMENSVDRVIELLDSGASLSAVNEDGENLMQIALRSGSVDAARILFERGLAAGATKDALMCLAQSAIEGDESSSVEFLLDIADTKKQLSEALDELLTRACASGSASVADWLLARGADCSAEGSDESSSNPMEALVEFLDGPPTTVLTIGVGGELVDMDSIPGLEDEQARVQHDVSNQKYETAVEIGKALVKAGANPSRVSTYDIEGQEFKISLLGKAAAQGNHLGVKALLELGANPFSEDETFSPLRSAVLSDDVSADVILELCRNGALNDPRLDDEDRRELKKLVAEVAEP